jgi:hypothetical protein
MNSYRKIWESHYGPIPKDSEGRSYEIHHIDGNHSNDSIENLKLVTIREHYDIHFEQDDYGACLAIIMRMNVPIELSKKLQSELSRKVALRRIAEGTHNFSGDLSKEVQARRLQEGTHNFQGVQGTRNAIQRNRKLVELGKHPWAGELGKKHNQALTLLRIEKGTHNFQGDSNPNKNMPKVICPYCNKEGGRNQMKRYHFDNCKNKE